MGDGGIKELIWPIKGEELDVISGNDTFQAAAPIPRWRGRRCWMLRYRAISGDVLSSTRRYFLLSRIHN